MCQYVQPLGQFWDPRHYAIYPETEFAFDPKQVLQLQPNSCIWTPSFSLLSSAGAHVPARTLARSLDAKIRGFLPYFITLTYCSTRNLRSNCSPILANVHLYRIPLRDVFDCSPLTRTSTRSVDAEIQEIIPSCPTMLSTRPGTSAMIAPQFLSPCVCSVFPRLMSSSSVHQTVRAHMPSMLGSKALRHMVFNCFCV
jgi:hypothetical protein